MNTIDKSQAAFNKLYDPAFRASVRNDPTVGAQELGYTSTPGVRFVVKENTPKITYCALNLVADSVKLSQDDLIKVSAGIKAGTVATVGSVGSASTAGSACTTFSSAGSAGTVGSVGTIGV